MSVKVQRLALVMAALVCAVPAKAEEMRADEARHFIAGKHFAYNCFRRHQRNGRIYPDGSVAGYIQPGGKGPALAMWCCRPARCARTATASARRCARLPFEPCFISTASARYASAARSRPGLRLLQFHEARHPRGSAARTELPAAWRPRLGGRGKTRAFPTGVESAFVMAGLGPGHPSSC